MKQPLRIVYSAGPGDVIRTYRHWAQGMDDPTQVSMTYSGMFYDLCSERGDSAFVIAACQREDRLENGRSLIVHRPARFSKGPGPLFYVGQMWSDVRLIASALWYRADVVVVACGNTSWFPLRLLPFMGITVVASLHCRLWSKYRKLSRLQLLMRRLRVAFFTRSVFRVLSISHDVTSQLNEMTAGHHQPVVQFNPTFRRRHFEGIASPARGEVFRALFVGRVDAEKGVYDLLETARRFLAMDRTDIHFDICGDGPALVDIRRRVGESHLADVVQCHGHCGWERMREMYSASHVVVVPTSGAFVEGFNKVVAEAVLAGRPVVTSDACPAVDYIGDAVLKIPVDDVHACGNAILALCDDANLYERKRLACLQAQEQFYDMERSWMGALRRVLNEVRTSAAERHEAEATSLGTVN